MDEMINDLKSDLTDSKHAEETAQVRRFAGSCGVLLAFCSAGLDS